MRICFLIMFGVVALCAPFGQVKGQVINSFKDVTVNTSQWTTTTNSNQLELISLEVPQSSVFTENCSLRSGSFKVAYSVTGNLYARTGTPEDFDFQDPTKVNYYKNHRRYILSVVFVPLSNKLSWGEYIFLNSLRAFDRENFSLPDVIEYNDIDLQERFMLKKNDNKGEFTVDLSKVNFTNTSIQNYLMYVRMVFVDAGEEDNVVSGRDAAAISRPIVFKMVDVKGGFSYSGSTQFRMCEDRRVALPGLANGDVVEWFQDRKSVELIPRHIPDATGEYEFLATDVNGCKFSSGPFDVTIVQKPNPPKIVSPATGAYTNCADRVDILLDTSSTDGNNIWFFYSNIVNHDSTQYTALLPGTYSIYNENDVCSSTVEYIDIIANQITRVPVIAAPNVTLCEGGVYTLTVSNPVAGLFANVYRNGVPYRQNQDLNSIGKLEGDYFYTIKFTDGACESPESNQIKLTTTEVEAPNLVINGLASSCVGSNLAIQAENTAYPLDWYQNGKLVGDDVYSIEITQTSEIRARYVGTTCPSPLSATKTIELGENIAAPTVKAPLTRPVCDNEATLISPTYSDVYDRIEWLHNGNLINYSATSLMTTTSGTYKVRIWNKGCSAESPEVEFVAESSPEMPVFIQTSTRFYCPHNGSKGQLIEVQDYPYIRWYKDGILLQNQNTAQLVAEGEGSYIAEFYSNQNACTQKSDEWTVTSFSSPVQADAGIGQFVIDNETVRLAGSFNHEYTSVKWYPEDIFISNGSLIAVALPTKTTEATLEVTSVEGCIFTDSVSLVSLPNAKMNNVLTPNSDDKNDRWRPNDEYLEISGGCRYTIFDVSGNYIFEAPCEAYWNGKQSGQELEEGVYLYKILLNSSDRESKTVYGEIYYIKKK